MLVGDDLAKMIVDLYSQGMTIACVAKKIGTSFTTLRCWMKKHGVQMRSSGESIHFRLAAILSDETIASRVRELYEEGQSIREIASQVGLGSSVLNVWMHTQRDILIRNGGRERFSNRIGKLIARDYVLGETIKKLKQKYGGSCGAVVRTLDRQGIRRRVGGNPKKIVDLEIARSLLADGKSITAAGAHLGVSGGGLVGRFLSEGNSKITDEIARELAKQYAAGKTIADLAKKYCKSHIVIKRAIVSAGGLQVDEVWKWSSTGGYVYTLVSSDDPLRVMANASGVVLEHRLRMAKYLGRPLFAWETVHHRDLDKKNNEITNLQLRILSHGSGAAYRCSSCGSDRLEAVDL